jgi:hypothetical protein
MAQLHAPSADASPISETWRTFKHCGTGRYQ